MIISSNDIRFWDVRTRERRLRRGEMTKEQLAAYLKGLPDAADKGTASVPLEEPDERAHLRRQAAQQAVRISLPDVRSTVSLDSDDDDLDDIEDDLDDEDDDDI